MYHRDLSHNVRNLYRCVLYFPAVIKAGFLNLFFSSL